MKKFSLFILLACACICVKAQSLKFLSEENRIKLEIDFSEAAINGYTEETILEFEEDWQKDQPVLYQKLQVAMNEAQVNRQYGKFNNAKYTLVVMPQVVNSKGDMRCNFVIRDQEGNVLSVVKGVSAKGGKYGSFMNLVGDGMKHSGKEIAKTVEKFAR